MSQTVPDRPLFAFLNQFKLISLVGTSALATCLLETSVIQPARANSVEQGKHVESQYQIAQLPSLPTQNLAPPNFSDIQPQQVNPNYNQFLPIPTPMPNGVAQPPSMLPARTWQEELSARSQSHYPPLVATPQPYMQGAGNAPGVIQQPYVPQVPSHNAYPYGVIGQPLYVQTAPAPLPVPANPGIPQPNSTSGNALPPAPGNNLNGMMVPYGMVPYAVPGQPPYLPAPVMPQPNAIGGTVVPLPPGNNLNGMMVPYGMILYAPVGQAPYLPPPVMPQPNAIGGTAVPLPPGNNLNGMMVPYAVPGQLPYLPPSVMPQPNTVGNAANQGSLTSYYAPSGIPIANPNTAMGQQLPTPSNPFTPVGSYFAPVTTQLPALPNTTPPSAPNPNLAPIPQTPANPIPAPPATQPTLDSQPVSASALQLQGVYSYQGDESSARARVGAVYPLAPRVLVGATVDLTDGNAFADSRTQGLSLNEFYLATSLENVPNLRFVIGQLDLTSYFDRNSFAKDGASQFFNSVFQTNPALVSAGVNSRPGALVNWSITDNIEAKAAVFSSARAIGDFALDGFATEVGIRYGNAIIRGTYATARDAGTQDGFQEAFQVARSDSETGILRADREESYGVNAEVYIPNLKMGIFGRYGRYENRDLDLGGDTYSLGVSFLDVFSPDDRLGLAYGRSLSNDKLRRQAGNDRPDVLELYYDFRFLSNLRLGFTFQERNNFSETIFGFRLKTEFNVSPIESIFQ
ncbi:Carbohydrate-selective porin OprB [Gloeocapsa sp. PCC 7428]|uniref:carbohydrate porin n=1 Tax=Gloeocapsa sp. PCC 7428 TaxID=1173026 RepID=UPI0002A5F5A8|nr:carbohydrate porin [Gloeocapsa sp. PCC 7428]AFZ32012.1 Carbohydrate-selective porin OprB [Gloeocapsa sp. PCC 7428]